MVLVSVSDLNVRGPGLLEKMCSAYRSPKNRLVRRVNITAFNGTESKSDLTDGACNSLLVGGDTNATHGN